MEADDDDIPDDQFLGQLGRCPHCGTSFPSSGGEVTVGVYSYAVDLGGGRAGAQGGTILFGRCGACHTELWAPGEGCREWAECDPSTVAWHRNRNPVFGR